MAANEYYNPSLTPLGRRPSDATSPHSPHPYAPSSTYSTQHYTPSVSTSYEDSTYQPQHDQDQYLPRPDQPYYQPYTEPYSEQSQQSLSSQYYASGGGGREHEPSAYADDIPLREHPGKHGSEMILPDHLPDDPAITDRPTQNAASRRRKQGFFQRKIPWVVYTFTLIQVCVFIAELAKNGALTKTPIEIHPNFNPMIGPSPYVLINMGARYVPCMRNTSQGMNDTIQWPCPNTTSSSLSDPSNDCKLNQLCGFGDSAYTQKHLPNQWYRFIIPIFLHAGFIHIIFNMLLQLLLGRDMELEIGSLRFVLVYLSSGIFGFVLGGNFAPEGIASTGASGSLFGVIALMLLDLFYHWGERRSPWVDLAWLAFDIIISFVLGLLPGLDNFSHIGGFLMGLVLGVFLLHSPEVLRQRIGADLPPYASVKQARKRTDGERFKAFVKEPAAFFKGRKPLWWAWWLVRVGALIAVLVCFILLLKNFYNVNRRTCHWCRYLSCINIKNWCDIGQLTTTTSPSKRDVFVGPIPVSLADLL